MFESEHIGCGGALDHHHDKEFIVRGRKRSRTYYICDKCNEIIQVITMPSYEDYVLMGQIRVKWPELNRIRKEHEARIARLEAKKNENKNML